MTNGDTKPRSNLNVEVNRHIWNSFDDTASSRDGIGIAQGVSPRRNIRLKIVHKISIMAAAAVLKERGDSARAQTMLQSQRMQKEVVRRSARLKINIAEQVNKMRAHQPHPYQSRADITPQIAFAASHKGQLVACTKPRDNNVDNRAVYPVIWFLFISPVRRFLITTVISQPMYHWSLAGRNRAPTKKARKSRINPRQDECAATSANSSIASKSSRREIDSK